MTWTLDATTAETISWRRSEDGFIVKFVREGLGEPWSDDKKPPDTIDSFAPPLEKPTAAPDLTQLIEQASKLLALLQEMSAEITTAMAEVTAVADKGK